MYKFSISRRLIALTIFASSNFQISLGEGFNGNDEQNNYPKIETDKSKFLKTFESLKNKQILTREQAEWIEVIGQGWLNLQGFMREKEYLRSLHHQKPPIPIVLPCPFKTKDEIGSDNSLGLTYDYASIESGKNSASQPVAILRDIEVFEHRKEERMARTFGTTHQDYPYIKNFIMPSHDYLCGGSLVILSTGSDPKVPEFKPSHEDDLDEFRLTPSQLRKTFSQYDAIFAFQLRNPIHNGHALLMQDTYMNLKKQGFKNPALWISPLGGWTKDDDVPLDVRMKQHQALIQDEVFGKDLPVILSIFPSPMLYAGPREVQWHALARQVSGATHYIVGRDPAGAKHPSPDSDARQNNIFGADMYSPWDGQTMLKFNEDLKNLTLVPFQFAAYDKTIGKMSFFDPSRKDDFLSISGTKMRKMAATGEKPPKGFMEESGWKILVEYYDSLNNKGSESKKEL